jgi:DNA-3-methyladenine glycosylase
MSVLPEFFYAGEVVETARNLLGKRLERRLDGVLLSGMIIETEAYRGEEDLACHARSGKTQRTAVMYGLPGRAYVYFTYGMHWCFNAVCGPLGFPSAVLIRAVLPQQGLEVIAARRNGRKPEEWCSGPARLCQAFGIDGALNGAVLCDDESPLWISDAPAIPDEFVRVTPRIGIERTPEPWRSKPWRFVASLKEPLSLYG